MLKSLSMTGVGPAAEMSIEFAPRLNVLTGDNGLGKSFLLDMAWRGLTGSWARGVMPLPRPDWMGQRNGTLLFTLEPRNYSRQLSRLTFAPSDYEWKVAPEQRSPGVVIYAGVDGDFLVSDAVRSVPNAGPSDEPEESGTFHLTADQVWRGKSALNGKRYCNGLIQDWVSWQKGGDSAFAELTRVLEALSPSPTETLRPGKPVHIDLVDETEHPTIEMAYGETVPLVFASAGVRRIAALAYILVWTWKAHSRASGQRGRPPAVEIAFLVDEVESHLHPQWQRRVVPALLGVMNAMKLDVAVQLILATHSPLVMASIESNFDPDKDALFHLELRERKAVLEKVEWAKQGDATNWLVSESFGLKQARSIEAERAIEAAEAFMRGESTKTKSDLDAELRRVLAGHDDFWPRWVVATHPELAGPKG